ncbi:major facilitator superfamily domain-containing protein [Plectosphaerella plurivora]|uniref:Major facilitator superfamily domain-containing protein n=1 Tax=Plectosphaerella plurivora TaxID=936078 RepID=A0A9P9ABR4_9PEZI|nr:major facilitator superfamily domain-containing protein [Plectosphaerella plurivora]
MAEPPPQFDPKAEARLRRKIDRMIVPIVSLLYLFCFIDRANIGNARLAGFERDLQLKGNDYNTVLSVFYISYIILEIPAIMLCKLVGPGWFLPLTSVGFGLVSILTAFVSNLSEVCAVRFVLGIFEAGMLPGIAYYMSRWYRRAELTYRLSLYIVMSPLAGAFGGLLASGILTLDSFGRFTQWRMIFAIEGIITVGLSVLAIFLLTDRPETAKWLTDEEKQLAVDRIRSERLAASEVLDKMDKTKFWNGISSPVTLSTSFVFLLGNITGLGLAFFAPTIVRTIYPDKTVVQQQLLTVPPYVAAALCTVLIPAISYRTDKRQLFIALCGPPMMVGFTMFLASTNPYVRYAASFLVATTAFTTGPLTNAQVSANVIGDAARSSAIGFNVMLGNLGGLIATWSYLPWDSPNYRIGNGLNLATSSSILVVSLVTMVWMKNDNKRRDQRAALADTAELNAADVDRLDWKHPEFRWAI